MYSKLSTCAAPSLVLWPYDVDSHLRPGMANARHEVREDELCLASLRHMTQLASANPLYLIRSPSAIGLIVLY